MSPGADPVLHVEHVRLRYRNGALGILDVSFQVRGGQVVALLGPNGAGKTSSVRAASGFLKTEGARVISGTVVLGGVDVTNAEPHRRVRLGVSFIPERDKVFPSLTVAENLTALGHMPKGGRRRELFEFVDHLFPILAERRRQQAGKLSGGQRQMLALARGIISDPKVLIVDEMTLGLHHSLHPPLFDAVRAVARNGTAVVVVDESAGFALRAADYCYLLSSGEVREEGTPERFRGRELVTAGYLETT